MAVTEIAPAIASPYARANDALRRLHVARDAEALRHLVDALLDLGLTGPARELIRDPGQYADGEALLRRMSGPSGKRSWARYSQRFETNLAVLEQRGVDAAGVRAAWKARAASLELYGDANGVDQILWRTTAGSAVFVPAVQDHVAFAEELALPADARELMPGPYLFDGVELGWFFERVWRATRNSFHGYSSALYVVEPDAAALALALHLHDWREILADEAVWVFCGSDASEQFAATLRGDPDLPLPKFQFMLTAARAPAPPAGLIEIVESVVRERQAAADASWREMEERYANRDAKYYAARFGEALAGRRALRVLGRVGLHTSFLKYSMRDAEQALQRRGCVTQILIERRQFEQISTQTFHRAILDFEPDLILAIDHPRSSFVGRVPTNIPLLTWDQDNLPHLFNEATMKQLGALDVVVGMPKLQLIARGGLDPRQFLAAPMATSPSEYGEAEFSEEELARHRCDVSFVSHASQPPADFHREQLARHVEPELHTLLERIFALAPAYVSTHGGVDGRLSEQLLRDAEQQAGVRITGQELRHHLLNWHIWRLCDRLFRHEALEWAAAWARRTHRRLRIYGNGWENHPTLAEFAAGPAQNGRELACIHCASTINLQLMPAGFLHQRGLDGLCAGGFFLTRTARGDRGDPRLQRLHREFQAVGATCAADLVAHPAALRALEEIARDFDLPPDQREHAFQFVTLHGTWPYPAAVLPRFAEIEFASAESFAQAADRFLAAPAESREIASAMREVVISRFGYDALMEQFLRFHAAWLGSERALPGE